MAKRWITTGHTESGDELPILAWKKKPTDEEVDTRYRLDEGLEIEYEEVGFVHHETRLVEI